MLGAPIPCTPGAEQGPRLLTGLQACQLALSTRTVWARCPNGDLARRYGITDKNPAGDYWKKTPGCASWLTGRCLGRGAPEGDGEWPGAGHLWLAGGGDFLAVWSSKVPQLAQGPPWAGGNRCLTAVPAVTSSDELWAVGPSGYLLQRLTKMFRHSRSTLKSGQATTPHLEELEDEWEVI